MLAGLPQSPSLYNPLQNPQVGAASAATRCWSEMEKQGYISEPEYEDAIDEPIGLNPGNRYEEIREPYFFDFVEQQLIEEYGVNTVRQGGLKVQTTIDPQLQEAGREAIENHLYYSTDPSARRSSRSTPTTATSRRWPRAAATPTRSSTSPRRDIGSPARPPRPWR